MTRCGLRNLTRGRIAGAYRAIFSSQASENPAKRLKLRGSPRPIARSCGPPAPSRRNYRGGASSTKSRGTDANSATYRLPPAGGGKLAALRANSLWPPPVTRVRRGAPGERCHAAHLAFEPRGFAPGHRPAGLRRPFTRESTGPPWPPAIGVAEGGEAVIPTPSSVLRRCLSSGAGRPAWRSFPHRTRPIAREERAPRRHYGQAIDSCSHALVEPRLNIGCRFSEPPGAYRNRS